MLFDTHAHLNDPVYQEDLDTVIKEIQSNEDEPMKVINCGYDERSSQKAVELTQKYEFMYATVGMHPHDSKEYSPEIEERFCQWLQLDKVVALGEIGLDYHYDHSPREIQRDIFVRQMKLAKQFNKPVVIHSRESSEDTYELIKTHLDSASGGLLHSFSQSTEMMKRYLDFGMFFSISGVVTFKNAHHVRDTVKEIPLERMMIETDAPYMTPVPYRGKRNLPQYVKFVAQVIAELKGVSYEEIVRITYENAMHYFRIKK